MIIDPSTILYLWLCGDRQDLVLHDGVSLNLSPERYVGSSYLSISVIPETPPLPTIFSECGPVIQSNVTVVIVVHFKRGFGCLNALLIRVFNESSIFCIFILCMLLHTVLAVQFVVGLHGPITGTAVTHGSQVIFFF